MTKEEIKAELVTFLDGNKPYIKLIKNPKSNAWEIKVFQGTTKEDMAELKALIDDTHEKMQKGYGSFEETI